MTTMSAHSINFYQDLDAEHYGKSCEVPSHGRTIHSVYNPHCRCVCHCYDCCRCPARYGYTYYQTPSTNYGLTFNEGDLERLEKKYPDTAKKAKQDTIKYFEDILEKLKKEE